MFTTSALRQALNFTAVERLLDEAVKEGHTDIHLSYDDFFLTSQQVKKQDPNITDHITAQILAVKATHAMCSSRNLSIISLGPITRLKGLVNQTEHLKRMEKLGFMLRLCQHLRTEMIWIQSNFLPLSEVTSDTDLMVSDLKQAAELGLACIPRIWLTYEAVSWGRGLVLGSRLGRLSGGLASLTLGWGRGG
ncbi:hypothetical protein B0T14DRAFT_591941 [Immersiella caudata]|uniref:Uncharacterized protein n=1 Tax=Immersiella caudata TaxID=314043 RepID=A0AA39WEJ8_9PEZI|nr:hypothetical protein B0T14DRAFT_591941 [Immersiella caudata]